MTLVKKPLKCVAPGDRINLLACWYTVRSMEPLTFTRGSAAGTAHPYFVFLSVVERDKPFMLSKEREFVMDVQS